MKFLGGFIAGVVTTILGMFFYFMITALVKIPSKD